MNKYKAVSCQFYDKLELLCVKKIKVKIDYLYKEENRAIEDVILNLETKNKEEFLILSEGLKLRLDTILNINKEKVSEMSCNV